MSLSSRAFLVTPEEKVLRLNETDYYRLCKPGAVLCVPSLADERVRWASIVVRMANRRPVEVVRPAYARVACCSVPTLSVMARKAGTVSATVRCTTGPPGVPW